MKCKNCVYWKNKTHTAFGYHKGTCEEIIHTSGMFTVDMVHSVLIDNEPTTKVDGIITYENFGCIRFKRKPIVKEFLRKVLTKALHYLSL